MPASTETPVPGGFRRTSALPPATAAIRLRERLIAAAFGRPSHIARGLETLHGWNSLVPLLAGRWFGDVAAAPERARWTIEKRLAILGTPAVTVAQAYEAAIGAAVKVTGIVRRMRTIARADSQEVDDADGSESHIGVVWKNSTRLGGKVRQFIEEGRDFLLADPQAKEPVDLLVMAQSGQLVDSPGGGRLLEGDAVTALGFIDRVVDPDPRAVLTRVAGGGAPLRVPPLRTVLRSGDQLGLLLWKAP